VVADKENIVFSFQVWKQWIEEHVFTHQPVQVILVNKKLKKIADIKSLEEDEKKAASEMNDTSVMATDSFKLQN
jgi:hypothetical protein